MDTQVEVAEITPVEHIVSSMLVDDGVVRAPHEVVVEFLLQIGKDLGPAHGREFHAGPSLTAAPAYFVFYTHIPCCYVLCVDSGIWPFKRHHLLLEFQFLHDDNWGHEVVIRAPGVADVVRRHLAAFAQTRGVPIRVSERYDLPTWDGGGY